MQWTIVILILAAIIPAAISQTAPSSTFEKFSPFWERKIKTLYTLLDKDGDGVLTINDFDAISGCLIDAGKLDTDDAKELKEAFDQIYRNFYQADGLPCSFDQCLQQFEQELEQAKLPATNVYLSQKMFSILDSDNDRQMDEEEFSVMIKCFESTDEAAGFAFQKLDTNQDGKISEDKFFKIRNDFNTLQTEGDPSQYLYGPLLPPTTGQDDDDSNA